MYGHTQITMFQTGYANSCHCKALLIEIETCWCRKMCVIVWLIFVETMPKGEPKSQTFQGQTQRALSPAYIQIQALHTMDNWYMWIRMLTTLPRDDFYHVLWQSCHRPSYRPYAFMYAINILIIHCFVHTSEMLCKKGTILRSKKIIRKE